MSSPPRTPGPAPHAPAPPAPSPPPSRPPSSRSGTALVAIAAACWGTWSLFLRPTGLPATLTSPIIFLVVGLAALPAGLRGPPTRWDRTTLVLIALNAGFDALNVLAFFAALGHTTVAIAVLTHYLAPIVVALAAPRIDRVITRGAGLAAAVALAGLVIILEPWRAPAHGAITGALLGAGSAICYAGNSFTLLRIAPRIGAARALAYHALLAAVAMTPLAAGQLGQITPRALALLIAGSVVLGAGAGVAYTLGLTRIGTARAAVLTFIEPIVAVAVGAIVWDEPLHPIALLGGALVLGAGISVARKTR